MRRAAVALFMVYRCDTDDDDRLAAMHFLLYANAFGGNP